MLCADILARWKLPLAAGVVLAVGGWSVSAVRAQEQAAAAKSAATEAKGDVPLSAVVLYNSGVGFFEHRGQVEGDAQIDLRFRVDDINDLLKSMVLQDLGGGHISTVTYASKDPITKTLKTFSIDLTDNPTLAKILSQVRGERIEVEAPGRTQGTIVGIEQRQRRTGKDDEVVTIDVLNLLTDDGLKSIPLEQIATIKLLDERLNQEFKQALAILATSHATDKKTVTLKFAGEGKRPVRVGYIQQAPIWKTSYRLVVKDEGSPLLQGWAIVENSTEEDWNDVRLTLVSGRPISFVMNLYDPLYVNRPLVEPELFASLRPQRYEQDLLAREQLADSDAAAKAVQPGIAQRRMQERGPGMSGIGGGVAAEMPVPTAAPAEQNFFFAEGTSGVESAAQAGDVGELFQYVISEPVTLVRQRSAMLPIVNGPVEAEKVSIFNANVQPKHPLNGLKLRNTTDLHLMQGPITVFDGGAYAGDAQIGDLPPGGDRLLSYAIDLDTEVAQLAKSEPEHIVGVKIAKGVFESNRKLRRTMEYTVKNSGKSEKKVLVEHPRDINWTLIEPKEPAETTRDRYRFAVTAVPGKPVALIVTEEMTTAQQYVVGQMDDGMIQFYLSAASVNPAIKDALREVVERRRELEAIVADKQNLAGQIAAISEEQSRIRENMSRLERNSELYNRYVKKFAEQEDQIERFRTQINQLSEQERHKREALDAYVAGLNLG
jgi:hypothetical protein